MVDAPTFKEDHISQIPALQVLQNLGFQYLSPIDAMKLRGERASNVILDGILEEQLRRMNAHPLQGGRVSLFGREHPQRHSSPQGCGL